MFQGGQGAREVCRAGGSDSCLDQLADGPVKFGEVMKPKSTANSEVILHLACLEIEKKTELEKGEGDEMAEPAGPNWGADGIDGLKRVGATKVQKLAASEFVAHDGVPFDEIVTLLFSAEAQEEGGDLVQYAAHVSAPAQAQHANEVVQGLLDNNRAVGLKECLGGGKPGPDVIPGGQDAPEVAHAVIEKSPGRTRNAASSRSRVSRVLVMAAQTGWCFD